MPPPPPTLILGGGLAGAAAAISLARAGCTVTLLERERAPRHKVCGEFLSTEALHLLAGIGFAPEHRGAEPIYTVRLCSAHRTTASALPFPARSLTRCSLDAALLQCAEAAGVLVHRGSNVESLTRDRGLWHARLADGEVFAAPAAILATGKHDLRGLPRPPGRQNDLVALKMYLRLVPAQAAALVGSVELLLHPHGYTGLEPVEGGRANLCALVRRSHLTHLGGWPALLHDLCAHNPHAQTRLAGAIPLLPKPLAITAIPYGFVRQRALAEALYAVGDQAAVIPSFTGDGMSIALYTGLCAAQALCAHEPAERFQRQLGRDLRHQVARATALARALLHPQLKPVVTTVAHLWPGSLRVAARATRLSRSALSRVA